MTRPHPIKEVEYTDTFRKDYKRLPDEIKEEVKEALRGLVKDPIPKRLRLEKLKGYDKIFHDPRDPKPRLQDFNEAGRQQGHFAPHRQAQAD